MSGAAFTPGPWSILPNGHCVAGPDPKHAEFGVSGVAMCGMARRTEAEARANARLIAAAPDLLQTLRSCVSVLRAAHMHKLTIPNLVAHAESVIAKATGEGA